MADSVRFFSGTNFLVTGDKALCSRCDDVIDNIDTALYAHVGKHQGEPAQLPPDTPLDEKFMPQVEMIVQSAYRAGWARSLDELLSELQRDETAGVPISLQRIIAAAATVHERGKTAVLVLDGSS